MPGWADAIAAIVALPGGLTNHNYVVRVRGAEFVLRLSGNDTDLLGIDRVVELQANRQAAALGIAPEVVSFVEPEGFLVTRFVVANTGPDLADPDVMHQIGAIMRRFHASDALPATFDCFRIPETYARTASARGVTLPEALDAALAIAGHIEVAFATTPEPLVPAHNDLLNANFLRDATGRIWLIDWEYAGMNSRWFDLGNLATNHELDEQAREALLHAYNGRVSSDGMARIELMQVMSDLREAMWGVVQQGISTLDVDFVAYADRFFDRLLHNASAPSFRRAIDRVERG